jgi:hypothetical protein
MPINTRPTRDGAEMAEHAGRSCNRHYDLLSEPLGPVCQGKERLCRSSGFKNARQDHVVCSSCNSDVNITDVRDTIMIPMLATVLLRVMNTALSAAAAVLTLTRFVASLIFLDFIMITMLL